MHRCARAHTLAGAAIFMQMGVELFSEKIVGAVAFAGAKNGMQVRAPHMSLRILSRKP